MEHITSRIKEELLSCTQREGMGYLVKHLEEIGYFKASCSSQYHLCKEGGLAEHSFNVFKMMLEMWEKTHYFASKIDDDSLTIVALLHDVGKADYFNKPNYIENILKSGKQSPTKPFITNSERLNIPHEVASIHIISKFIELTEQETFAILFHNGLYTPTGYATKGKEQPLQQLLHFCDMYVSRFVEKTKEEN